jgi:hypothetical protein
LLILVFYIIDDFSWFMGSRYFPLPPCAAIGFA